MLPGPGSSVMPPSQTTLVIASQPVRPDVAGLTTGSAKQSRTVTPNDPGCFVALWLFAMAALDRPKQ
jgi:hypothetical protein